MYLVKKIDFTSYYVGHLFYNHPGIQYYMTQSKRTDSGWLSLVANIIKWDLFMTRQTGNVPTLN